MYKPELCSPISPDVLLPEVWKNLFIILKIRSYAKYLHFSELNMKTRKSLRVVSLSASYRSLLSVVRS